MRVVISLCDLGELRLMDVPPVEAGILPPGCVCLRARDGDHGAVVILMPEQVFNLCAEVIQYIPTREENSDGSQPSDN